MSTARKITFPIPPDAPVVHCRACDARIAFVETSRGKLMPLEASGEHQGESHFAFCAAAARFRRAR